jgi:hypothetical protein
VKLAARPGVVTQPIVSDYERGELRLHGELIVKLTETLRVRAGEVLGLEPPPRAAAPGDGTITSEGAARTLGEPAEPRCGVRTMHRPYPVLGRGSITRVPQQACPPSHVTRRQK